MTLTSLPKAEVLYGAAGMQGLLHAATFKPRGDPGRVAELLGLLAMRILAKAPSSAQSLFVAAAKQRAREAPFSSLLFYRLLEGAFKVTAVCQVR